MTQRRVLVAVTGGIAAYKVPEVIRALVRAGCAVRCATTANAAQFVTPLVLQTLSGESVRTDLFDREAEGQIDHIALADWAELVVVAPATANALAKLATGIADDLVSTLLLATRAPVLVAPAMNVNMWQHPATQANVATLRERGVRFVGPASGALACGWEGEGRMAEPVEIAAEAERCLGTATLAGEVVVVTAGGTREPLDPVRVLANRSSGKMGYAIAAEAARRGAEVVLVSGPTALATPPGVRRVDVETGLEMHDAVHAELSKCSVFIGSAAVADFRPATRAEHKIKKESLGDADGLVIELVRNPDILAEVSTSEQIPRRNLSASPFGHGFGLHFTLSFPLRFSAIVAASLNACNRLRGSPVPFPAFAKSVPCSTDVRMIGSPSVTFTPCQIPSILAATCP
jgi:phosphopantothenoylcysteine decarboxylase/phosphopantothenate--cysteine ligase